MLLFDRVANNLLVNGYYPTDDETLARVVTMLGVQTSDIATNTAAKANTTQIRICDPCCGEGRALAEIKARLTLYDAVKPDVKAFGLEYDRGRYMAAKQAKQHLDFVAHGDIQNARFGVQQYGLVYLNPPYGDMLTDKAGINDKTDVEGQKQRFELYFLQRMLPTLQTKGVLVYIIPYSQITKAVATLISRNFEQVTVHLAPETQFKQVVIAGIKRRAAVAADSECFDRLILARAVETPPETLPENWLDMGFAWYEIPQQSNAEHYLVLTEIDAETLGERVLEQATGTLWPRFETTFTQGIKQKRQPLVKLSPWHMALGLASGQISGIVTSSTGRRLLVKGHTSKRKRQSTETATDAKDGSTTTVILTDVFKAKIMGIDVTDGSNLGLIVTIG